MNIEVSLEFMAGLIGIKPGELSEAIKNDEELKPQAEIYEFVKSTYSSKLNDVRKEARDEGYGRGKRESLTGLEKTLAEKYGIEAAGIDKMISAIIKKSGKEQKITPELIKASETYVQDLKTEIDKRLAIERDFETFKTGVTAEEQKRTVKSEALKILEQNKFALPKSQKVKDRLLDTFVEEIMSGRKIAIKDGEISVTDENGNPIRNDLQNVMTFNDVSVSLASEFFEIQNGDGRQSPGAQTPPSGGGAHKFPEIKSQEDFINHYRTISDLDEKRAFKQHYDQLVKENKI